MIKYKAESIDDSGISARIVADSISPNGKRITTFELEYHRYIHSEFMTHRAFSRNAASSRAIPVNKVIEQVENNPAMPIHWGKNQPGMQAREELDWGNLEAVIQNWDNAAGYNAQCAKNMASNHAHKQIVNRILEPYQFIKVVCTATEFDNFFELRDHEDAQPEIQVLARLMKTCMSNSEPMVLQHGEWHVPYVHTERNGDLHIEYSVFEEGAKRNLIVTDALKISASCCAQVSYRNLNTSIEKALDIYNRLVDSEPVHSSPFEHQSTPMYGDTIDDLMNIEADSIPLMRGMTHVSLPDKLMWSGNFQGFVQHRHLLGKF